jgi:hypothetical protein
LLLTEVHSVLLCEEPNRLGWLSLQCSLDGECVLSLLALCGQLLCLAGVVGCPAVARESFAQWNLYVLAIHPDSDVALGRVVVEVEVRALGLRGWAWVGLDAITFDCPVWRGIDGFGLPEGICV